MIGSLAGWVGGSRGVETVVLPTVPGATTAEPSAAALPLSGNGFRSGADLRRAGPRRRHDLLLLRQRAARTWGSGSSSRRQRHVLAAPSHTSLRTPARAPRSARVCADLRRLCGRRPDPGRSSAGISSTTRGSRQVDPRDHPVSPVPLGDSSRVVVGQPVAAIQGPVRPGELARRGGRIRDRALDPVAHLGLQRLGRDPDRRPDQPRQLGVRCSTPAAA